uniref:Uncharacterized protein n=1 Tax=Arundo donax TaxID=35708 RepID=A0A0A9ENI8_ARUDO
MMYKILDVWEREQRVVGSSGVGRKLGYIFLSHSQNERPKWRPGVNRSVDLFLQTRCLILILNPMRLFSNNCHVHILITELPYLETTLGKPRNNAEAKRGRTKLT